jgi:hypothetical protein
MLITAVISGLITALLSGIDNDKESWRIAEMITRIYFLNLVSYLTLVSKRREAVNEIILKHEKAYNLRKNRDPKIWLQPFNNALSELDEAQRSFEDAIVIQARGLAADRMMTMPPLWSERFELVKHGLAKLRSRCHRWK